VIVYVETNFLLELAYLQERSGSCEGILDLARRRAIALAIPAVSAAEARATWHRRATERREFHFALQKQIREISRSQPFHGLIEQSRDVVAALVAGGEESRERLESAIQTFASEATVIPLTDTVVGIARRHELAYSLTPQDALVLASVRSHAEQHTGPKCFVSQDAKGFAHPTVYDELSAVDCKVLVNFADALAYITNAAQSSPD
jgi:predicted nucleic acid-binding protein